MENNELYTYWSALNTSLNQSLVNECYCDINKHHSSTNRYYHNLEHVYDLICQIQRSKSLNKEERAILSYTAFFHDIIYNPKRSDNEYESALLAKSWLERLNVSKVITEGVFDIIKDTKNHQSDNYLSHMFIDMDLSILGASQEKFQEYSKKIRLEFSHLNDVAYFIGRKLFLSKILSRSKIFITDSYSAKYEIAARRNLKTEFKSL